MLFIGVLYYCNIVNKLCIFIAEVHVANEHNDKDISCFSYDELLNRAQQGWLIPGMVSEEQFWLLVGVSSMHSEKIISALMDYLVKGSSRRESCHIYHVNSGHFSIGLNRLQHISNAAAKLSKFY